ncbi:hypothetical protein, partial [Bradyrhizobium sp. TM233]|uniref:hypothetical protein n=1 Tax=Bradyrhizobium sp. TM233 TaxID=2599801 RepID=UPI0030C67C4D
MSQDLRQSSENQKQQTGNLLDAQSERVLSSSTTVQSSDSMKPSQLGSLVVKNGREKGRRKKKRSLGAKLAALSEVSSSQSG